MNDTNPIKDHGNYTHDDFWRLNQDFIPDAVYKRHYQEVDDLRKTCESILAKFKEAQAMWTEFGQYISLTDDDTDTFNGVLATTTDIIEDAEYEYNDQLQPI